MPISDREILESVRQASARAAMANAAVHSLVNLQVKQRVGRLARIAVIAQGAVFLGVAAKVIYALKTTEPMAVALQAALVPAVFGLAIGLAALWLHRYCSTSVELFESEMKRRTAELMEQLARVMGKQNSPLGADEFSGVPNS